MFNETNIKSIRFTSPQFDVVQVIYIDDLGNSVPYYFPVVPFNTDEWTTVKAAGYDLDKIYKLTIQWADEFENAMREEYEQSQNQNFQTLEKLVSSVDTE